MIPHWTFGDERRIPDTVVDIRDQRRNKRQQNGREKNAKRNKGRKRKKEAEREGDGEAGYSLSCIAAAHQKP